MFKLFSKTCFSALLGLLSLSATSSLMADGYLDDVCCYSPQCNRLYIGAFGGELFSERSRIRQTGVAFFEEAVGGPLSVDARGRSRRKDAGFGGFQIGYELSPICVGCSEWSVAPAAEFEAYFYRHKERGSLINPTDRLPEHDFVDSFRMNVGVYLGNIVFTLNNCCLGKFSPYFGGGVGAANIFLSKAKSIQVAPPEVGVNHFNSKRNDTCWAFAAQAKAGLKYNICERIHLFAEYRFLYVDSSRYILGSTVSPGHAPTTTWNVDVKDIWYNAFALGLQFDL